MLDEQIIDLERIGLDLSDCLLCERDGIIGWLCSYVPEEIIHASGFHPMRVRGKGNPIGKADALLHCNICPFVRSVLDDAVEGDLAYLSGMVFANSCDAMRRLADAWSLFIKKETSFFLDTPKDTNEISVLYYKEQLHDFAQALSRISPNEITNNSLFESIKIFNHTRDLMKEVSRLSSENLLSGNSAFNIMQMATMCDRVKFNQKLAQFIDQFSGNREVRNGVRILLTGCIMDQPEQIALLEDCGAHIVVNELCSGRRQFDYVVKEGGDPYFALAERYLKKASCARMKDITGRVQYLLDLSKENRIDGVIYYIIKFCDHYMWDMSIVRDALEENDIPVLEVEGDYMQGSFGPLNTRIQAFVESLQY